MLHIVALGYALLLPQRVSNGTGQSLVAQQTTNLNLWFNISNSGQNAFATVLTFLVPKSQLYFIRCDPNLVSEGMGSIVSARYHVPVHHLGISVNNPGLLPCTVPLHLSGCQSIARWQLCKCGRPAAFLSNFLRHLVLYDRV